MTGFVETLDSLLTYIVEISTIFMELAGICVLVSTAAKSFYFFPSTVMALVSSWETSSPASVSIASAASIWR